MDQSILMSAITYSKQGLPIIACCDVNHKCNVNMEQHQKMCRCNGKAPIIKWREKTETTAQEVIDWKNQFGEFNIGLPMGAVAGYIGIDVDGPGGDKMLQQLCGDNSLPETWKFTTGDGYRLLYQIPQGFKTKKLCLTDPDNKHSECAVLCDGQFSVIPPSLHFTGRRYEWVSGQSPDMIDCAMAPKWLLDAVRADRVDAVKRAEKKVNDFVVNLEQKSKPAFAEKMADFAVAEFSDEIPDELLNAEFKQPKSNNTGTSSKTEGPQKGWKELLDGPVIAEGGRDNAMMSFIGSLMSEDMVRRGGKVIAKAFIDQFNNSKLDPPLEEEALTVKLDTIWEREMMKSAEYKAMHDEKRKFIVPEIVQVLRNTLDEKGLTYIFDFTRKKSYFFKNGRGPWIEDPDSTILRNIIIEIFMETLHKPDWVTSGKLNEVIEIFKTMDSKDRDATEALFIDSKDDKLLQQFLPVDGNLLDWRTGEMTKWTKEYHSLSNFDINYDPTAKCPNWEQYMKDWLPEEDQRNFLQEFLGSAMLPLPDQDGRFVILAGTGANGKSVCLDTIENIFGSSMSASQELGRLSKDQFGAAKLYGKRLNICSELTEADGYIKDTSIMKRLTTGETINVEFKGKDGFEYRPIASHIFSTNSIPRVRDKSDGWFRRQVIIPFKQKFEAKQSVADMMHRNIQAERAGIFNWLLEGLRRKTERGYYILPDSLQDVQQQVRVEQDPLLQFTTLFLRVGEGITSKEEAKEFMGGKYKKATHGVSATLLHGLYQAWYRINISDKTGGATIKTFKQHYVDHYGTSLMGHCQSVARVKPTSVMLGIDFTYSEDFYYFLESVLESNIVGGCDGVVLQAMEILKKNCQRHKAGEKLEDC